ncbi:DUF488 domain-containing protein [Aquicella lusitana]|uniref:Uncharacterized protein DUF488 n=1 Tax=Aquicella lusitana TaxID=254246 RepID=A0A370GJH5_9COXI|nr:DUF488 domain-containing protein [Aquicella lusitana]RDI43389.1 uncharacterized protein DUF488 [Aquicella lusitana]VVC73539.1 hypothetical protein AQULUS_12820 [Aquicella lusitana]
MPTVYTIGHSNQLFSAFLEKLEAHGITHVVDVRTIPKSRHVPWSNQKPLISALQKKKIAYTHMPELGGLRHPHSNSINEGWRNASFRGFADYMQTSAFYQALKKLNQIIKKGKTVIMCAEALPWRCHRSLIADAEVIRNIKVLHIMGATSVKEHDLTDFARVDRSKRPFKVYYPSP